MHGHDYDITDFCTQHEPAHYANHYIRISPDGRTAIVGYVVQDDMPENPRDHYDLLGTLVAHERASYFADKNSYSSDFSEFIAELATEVSPSAGNKLEYWSDEANNHFLKPLYEARDWPAIVEIQTKIIDQIIHEALQETVIIPVNFYSQSYDTCLWQECGTCNIDTTAHAHIFVTPEEIVKEYGANTPETRAKAQQYLIGELKTLKRYLEGDTCGVIVERHELTENEQEWELADELERTFGYYGHEYAEQDAQAYVNSYWEETTEPEPTPAEYAEAA